MGKQKKKPVRKYKKRISRASKPSNKAAAKRTKGYKGKPRKATTSKANTKRTKLPSRMSPKKQYFYDSSGKPHPARGTTAKSRKAAGEGKAPTIDKFSKRKKKR